MIHHQQLNYIRRIKKKDDFLYPYYNGYSIAEVPASIMHTLGAKVDSPLLSFKSRLTEKKPPRHVIFTLIDGFSYFHLVKYHKRFEYWNRFVKKGDVYPVTSVFPSTTAAALTTIHTGTTPQEHGLPEWTVYFEEFESIIETLPFKLREIKEIDSLLKRGGNENMLYDGETVYQKLYRQGIKSYLFLYKPLAHTTYSKAVHKGSVIIPFQDGIELMRLLREKVKATKTPSYFFIYWGAIDSVAHHFGPGSPEHVDSISAFSSFFMNEFVRHFKKNDAGETLLVFTADHGQVNIKSEDIINLNHFPIIEQNFQLNKRGDKILPTGSPHDVFLFIEPKKLSSVVEFLKNELAGTADVITTQEAMKLGLFGTNIACQKFMRRIGNVLILPYANYHVWYEFLPGNPFAQLGIHGGLSEEEMVVPLGIARLADLIEETKT